MNAVAVYPDAREIRVIDQPVPVITAPREVKVRTIETGICGTDREICSFHYGTPPRGMKHLVIGHEMLGEVIEVGAEASELVPGDLVVPMVRRPCPHEHCVACRQGRQDFCYTGDFTERGIKGAHGFNCGLVVDDERMLIKVPPRLRDVAVLVEPLTIAEKALIQVHHLQQRLPWACQHSHANGTRHACHTAVVLGAGPIGLLGAMALRAAGFRTIVYSREPAPNFKSDLCAAFGAEYVSSSTDSIDALAARAGQIDVVYEAVGAASLAFDVMKVLGTNGVFVFTGVPGRKAPIQVDADVLMKRLVLNNQMVFGTVNADRDAFEAAIEHLADFRRRWPDALRALITGHYPIERHAELLCGAAQGIKNVIAIGS